MDTVSSRSFLIIKCMILCGDVITLCCEWDHKISELQAFLDCYLVKFPHFTKVQLPFSINRHDQEVLEIVPLSFGNV